MTEVNEERELRQKLNELLDRFETIEELCIKSLDTQYTLSLIQNMVKELLKQYGKGFEP